MLVVIYSESPLLRVIFMFILCKNIFDIFFVVSKIKPQDPCLSAA